MAADLEERENEVAKSRRPFWAAEMLVKALSDKIDTRNEAVKLSKHVLIETLNRVSKAVMVREILKLFVDECVDVTETRRIEAARLAEEYQDRIKVKVVTDDLNVILETAVKRVTKKEEENHEGKRKNKSCKEEWKKVWEGGPAPTDTEDRKKATARRRTLHNKEKN